MSMPVVQKMARPQTVIARVLVAQNADQPAAAQQLNRFLKPLFAIE